MLNKKFKSPKVSIILPVYNGEKFLEESLDSILNQTFKDIEIIIVNDGSIDNTLNIIKNYKEKDKRIVLINNKKNIGFANSLNIGIKNSKCKYIALSTADDISHPKRLEVQFNYLEKNPHIFLAGTSAIYIDENGKEIRRFRKYDNYKMLAWRMKRSCGIAAPSIIFRNEGFSFDNKYGGATDYYFYFTLIKAGKNITNIPDFLIKFRVHQGSMSIYNKKEQEFLRDQVVKKFKDLKYNLKLDEKIIYLFNIFIHYLRTMKEKKII